jgi:aminoglycoside 3-N-acetyltransferase
VTSAGRTEADVIAATATPATRRTIGRDLARLGIEPGDVVIVHSALSAMGFVVGGPHAVVLALLDAVAPNGTIVVPTQTGISDPSTWQNPPVPEAWWPIIRDEMPPYDPALTPTRAMGQIVECFRHHPDALRSAHPRLSFAANGLDAERIVGDHPLAPGLGDTSPLATLYELDAKVLLVGVTDANNTSLHLAEHRADWPGKRTGPERVPMVVDGVARWVDYEDLELDEDDFVDIGAAFERTGAATRGTIGAAPSRLCSQRAIVDFAVGWMNRHRT